MRRVLLAVAVLLGGLGMTPASPAAALHEGWYVSPCTTNTGGAIWYTDSSYGWVFSHWLDYHGWHEHLIWSNHPVETIYARAGWECGTYWDLGPPRSDITYSWAYTFQRFEGGEIFYDRYEQCWKTWSMRIGTSHCQDRRGEYA